MNFNFNNQLDFEQQLQKKIGMMHDDCDKDLDDLINDDPELRDLIKKGDVKKKKTLNADNPLDDLSLEDLESEQDEETENKVKELDDLLCEEDTEFKQKKEEEIIRKKTSMIQDELRKSTIQTNEPKINLKASVKNNFKEAEQNKLEKGINASQVKVSVPITDHNNESDEEFYDEKVEKFFHSVDKMKSIGVLQEELALMDHIIKFNTDNNMDFDAFENKKFFIQNQIDKINLLVESGGMDLNEYKNSITKELEFEKFILSKLDAEEKIKNKNFIKKRIEKRIELIENELKQEIEEDGELEPEQDNSKQPQEIIKSPTSTQNNASETINRKATTTNKSIITKLSIKESQVAQCNSEEPKEKKIKNKKLYDEITARTEEYRKAVEYFINIESLKQAEDARSKVSALNKALVLMESGKNVDEIDLPIGITPDYICNMTKQERLNNFSVIIKDFSKKKNDLNAQIKKALDAYTKLDQRTQAQHKKQFHESLKQKKTKLDNFTGIISKLMEMVKNPWIPAPLFVEKEEEEQVEKMNEDIGTNEILININKITPSNQSVYLRLIFEITKDKVITSLIPNKDGSSDFKYSTTIKLENSEIKYLHRKSIRLILVESSGFCCFKQELDVGECLIKFDPFKSKSQLDGDYAFKPIENTTSSTAADSKINVSFKIRQPTVEKEYIQVSRTVISITKTYPPFKGDNVVGVIDEEDKPKKINENAKVIKKQEQQSNKDAKQPAKQQEIPAKNKQDGPPREKSEVEYQMSDFRQEELENPDIIENMTSLKVLNFKISKVEEEIKKIEGRAPPKLREKLIKMKNLESQMGGEITINMYLGLLRFQLEHDRKLAKYFQDKKDMERTKLVAERIPILISEIEEALDYMTKNKS